LLEVSNGMAKPCQPMLINHTAYLTFVNPKTGTLPHPSTATDAPTVICARLRAYSFSRANLSLSLTSVTTT
jgi:hypothetical protein